MTPRRALRPAHARSRTLGCARSRARRRLRRTPLRASRRSSMTQRTDKLDQLLREEIGSIVTRDVADPRVGFVTITSVETTPDLRHAKVWVSVIGQPAERDGDHRRARSGHAVRPPRAGRPAAPQAHPGPARPRWTTPRSGGPACCSCSTTWSAARSRDATSRPANRCRPRSPACRTTATSARSRRSAVRPPVRAGSAPTVEGAPVTVDLSPYLDAVPDIVVERLRARAARAGRGPREPRRRHARGQPRDRPSGGGARRRRRRRHAPTRRPRCTTS